MLIVEVNGPIFVLGIERTKQNISTDLSKDDCDYYSNS